MALGHSPAIESMMIWKPSGTGCLSRTASTSTPICKGQGGAEGWEEDSLPQQKQGQCSSKASANQPCKARPSPAQRTSGSSKLGWHASHSSKWKSAMRAQ